MAAADTARRQTRSVESTSAFFWALGFLVVSLGCAPPNGAEEPPGAVRATPAASPLQIVATIAPLADLATRLGGDDVRVFALLPAGASPHSFSLAPKSAGQLERSRLVISVGHPSLPFETALLAALAGSSDLTAMTLLQKDSTRSSGSHSWLSPSAMSDFAHRISSQLAGLDPPNERAYRDRLASVLGDIEVLQAEIRQQLGDQPEGRSFLVYHPAWQSFAKEFGIEEIAVEHEGKETTARELTRLIERIRNRQPRVLFVQPGVSHRGAEALARELDLEIVQLDPLPEDWFGGMRAATATIVKGLIQP